MTTLAFRDGVLAADTMTTEGGVFVGTVTKIAQSLPRVDGTILVAGGCGEHALVERFLRWFRDNRPEDIEEPLMLALKGHPSMKEGEKEAWGYVFDHRAGTVTAFELDLPPSTIRMQGTPASRYFAEGSGARFAFGAMFMGASAPQAVRAAAAFDRFSGDEVEVIDVVTEELAEIARRRTGA